MAKLPELEKWEEELIQQVRLRNYAPFTSHYLRLPGSGTRYTAGGNPEDYELLFSAWKKAGQPEKFILPIDGNATEFVAEWDDINNRPIFLWPHGYIFLPWFQDVIASKRLIVVAEGGTGSAKTSGVGALCLADMVAHPGCDILNVAPSGTQAGDMMDEIGKWVEGTGGFEKFVVRSRAGDLWVQKPYPTMTVNVYGYPSTFTCMTLSKEGKIVLGKDKDRISIDEAGMIWNIMELLPYLVSRRRGLRRDGSRRGLVPGYLFLSNPHDNPQFDMLKRRAQADMGKPDGRFYYANPRTADNIYVTAEQIEDQNSLLTDAQQKRWHDGDAAAVAATGIIPIRLIERCHNEGMDDVLKRLPENGVYEERSGIGVIRYEIDRDENREYLIIGDPGTNDLSGMTHNGVPFIIVLDVTDFPGQPSRLVAMWGLDGGGRYQPWVEGVKYYILKYMGVAAYDATGTQTAFAEFPLEDWPIYPTTLAGTNKALGKTMFILFTGAGLFSWPWLNLLWHQAQSYRDAGVGVEKIPDDLISCFFVAALWLRARFYDSLALKFHWEENPDDDEQIAEQGRSKGRHHRTSQSRYRASRARGKRARALDDSILD